MWNVGICAHAHRPVQFSPQKICWWHFPFSAWHFNTGSMSSSGGKENHKPFDNIATKESSCATFRDLLILIGNHICYFFIYKLWWICVWMKNNGSLPPPSTISQLCVLYQATVGMHAVLILFLIFFLILSHCHILVSALKGQKILSVPVALHCWHNLQLLCWCQAKWHCWVVCSADR